MRDDSLPATPSEESPCRVVLDASSPPLRAWTAVVVAAIEPVADKKLARFRVRLDAPDGVVTINLALGTRMAPPLALGERARARAFMFPTSTGREPMVAIEVDGETRLFEGPLDEARGLADFTFTRGAARPDPSTGATRVTVDVARDERHVPLGEGEGFRVLVTPAGRWLTSGGHAEGRYGHSVFSLCKLIDNGAAPQAKRRPDDDRSVAVERIDGSIAVRLAAAAPDGVIERRVRAIAAPDASAPTTWHVTLAATGWRALLGLETPLPLVVSLPRGVALPLAVGDAVSLRALQAVVGNHPRSCVEVRVAGRAVLVDGDDDFLHGLAGVTVSKGPCTDPGAARDNMAPPQSGMVRVELDGVAGYTDDARRPRALDTASGRALFAGSWAGFGAGALPPGASPQTRLALARLR